MRLDALEARIRAYVATGAATPCLGSSLSKEDDAHKLYVIKYTPPRFVSEIVDTQCLFASKTPGYTWGDAVYVAPLGFPKSTMMYGAAGIVGWLDAGNLRCYDAINRDGISLYQQGIQYYPDLFTQLTTTVHANEANRELRNKFRGRFAIDCVLFSPDENCEGYVDSSKDFWLAITRWNPAREVSPGPSMAVRDLRWCAINTEAFEPNAMGHRPLFLPMLSKNRTFLRSSYEKLEEQLREAYFRETVVITEFSHGDSPTIGS